MYIAIGSDNIVLEIVSSMMEKHKTMKAYAKLNYKNLFAMKATKDDYIEYSNGGNLERKLYVNDGAIHSKIVTV